MRLRLAILALFLTCLIISSNTDNKRKMFLLVSVFFTLIILSVISVFLFDKTHKTQTYQAAYFENGKLVEAVTR